MALVDLRRKSKLASSTSRRVVHILSNAPEITERYGKIEDIVSSRIGRWMGYFALGTECVYKSVLPRDVKPLFTIQLSYNLNQGVALESSGADYAGHNISPIEYSALAVKLMIAKAYVPEYHPVLLAAFKHVQQKRGSHSHTAGNALYIADNTTSIAYAPDEKAYIINLDWLIAEARNPSSGQQFCSGIEFTRKDYRFFFGGAEEAAHYAFYESREFHKAETAVQQQID